MTEQIENDRPITGEPLVAGQRVHLFRSLNAMADFISVFKIENGSWRCGHTQDGRFAVELVYDVHREFM